jgi:hypothetical protein
MSMNSTMTPFKPMKQKGGNPGVYDHNVAPVISKRRDRGKDGQPEKFFESMTPSMGKVNSTMNDTAMGVAKR